MKIELGQRWKVDISASPFGDKQSSFIIEVVKPVEELASYRRYGLNGKLILDILGEFSYNKDNEYYYAANNITKSFSVCRWKFTYLENQNKI